MAMVVVMVVLVTQRNGIGEGTMEWQKKKKTFNNIWNLFSVAIPFLSVTVVQNDCT